MSQDTREMPTSLVLLIGQREPIIFRPECIGDYATGATMEKRIKSIAQTKGSKGENGSEAGSVG